MAMNKYGEEALKHWQRWRPAHLAAIQASEGGAQHYFTRLGERIARDIGELAKNMAAAENAELSADFETRRGQLNMIRNDAEQAVKRQAFLPPEPGVVEAEDSVIDGTERDEVDGDDEAETTADNPVADAEFEEWKEETLAALAGGRTTPGDLSREDLTRLREGTDNPRLLELAGIRDEDLRALGLM